MGYPGSTNRYETSFGVEYTMQVTNAVRIDVREKLLDIWGEYMKTSQKARIQYATKYARSSNYYKYSIGEDKGLENLHVIDQKKAIERKFTDWVNANNERKEKYGNALSLIEESYKNMKVDKARSYMSEALLRGPEIFLFAYRMSSLADLLEKPDENKERIDILIDRIKGTMDDYFKDYDAATDQKVVASMLKLYADKNAPEFYPAFFAKVQKKYKGDFNKYASKLFQKTMFADKDKLTAFLNNPTLKVIKKDLAFNDGVEIYDKYREISLMSGANAEKRAEGERLFLAGLMEMESNKTFYPDANSTMRLTCP